MLANAAAGSDNIAAVTVNTACALFVVDQPRCGLQEAGQRSDVSATSPVASAAHNTRLV